MLARLETRPGHAEPRRPVPVRRRRHQHQRRHRPGRCRQPCRRDPEETGQAHHHPDPADGGGLGVVAGISLAPGDAWNDPAPTWVRIDTDYNVQAWSDRPGPPERNGPHRHRPGHRRARRPQRRLRPHQPRRRLLRTGPRRTGQDRTAEPGHRRLVNPVPRLHRLHPLDALPEPGTRQRHPRAGRRARPVGRDGDGPRRDVRGQRGRRATSSSSRTTSSEPTAPSKPGSTSSSTRPNGPTRCATSSPATSAYNDTVYAPRSTVLSVIQDVADAEFPDSRQRLHLRAARRGRRRPAGSPDVPWPVRPVQPRRRPVQHPDLAARRRRRRRSRRRHRPCLATAGRVARRHASLHVRVCDPDGSRRRPHPGRLRRPVRHRPAAAETKGLRTWCSRKPADPQRRRRPPPPSRKPSCSPTTSSPTTPPHASGSASSPSKPAGPTASTAPPPGRCSAASTSPTSST